MCVVGILTRDIGKALDTIEVDSQKVSVSAPIPLKLCSLIPLKRVYSLSGLLSAFLCFENRHSMYVVGILTRDIGKALDTIGVD
jgi:hypothetical protein